MRILLSVTFALLFSLPLHADPVDDAVAKLTGGNAAEKLAAMDTLAPTGDQRAVAPLLSALKSGTPAVRAKSAEVLGYFRRTEVLDALIPALADADETVKLNVISSLSFFNNAKTVDALTSGLGTAGRTAKLASIRALLKLQAKDSVKKVLALASSKDTEIATEAILFAAAVGSKGDLKSIAAIRSSDELINVCLAYARIKLGQKGSNLQYISAILNSKNVQAKIKALQFIAELGDESHIDAVKKLTGDPAVDIRNTAVIALEKLSARFPPKPEPAKPAEKK